MVVDLIVKDFQKIAGCLAVATCILSFSAFNTFAQAQSSGTGSTSSSSTIFLKDRPAPKIIPINAVKRVKAKAPIRNFSTYGIADGLAVQSITSGFKDKEGNLWFGTNGGGVSKFDGRTFTSFDERHGIGNGVVRVIRQDKTGNFYFGTRTGLSVYNGETIINHYVKEGFPARPIICMIIDDNNNVWCGTQGGGLVKFDGQKFTIFTKKDGLVSDVVRSVALDKNGGLWVGTQNGVMTFDGIKFTAFAPEYRDKTIYDIRGDRNGNMWFASAGGILKFNGKQTRYFPMKDGASDSQVLCVDESDDGTLWFGTLDGGVIRYDGESFERITIADGLPSNRVWGIATDSEGPVWICTQEGIARYNGNSLVSFTTQQGLAHNLVWSIAQDNRGSLWFGHDNGIGSFDGSYFTNITSRDSLLHFFAVEVDSQGNVWGGGRQGLFRWNGRNLVQYAAAQGLASNQITDIVCDKSDVLWIGTEEGVTRFDGKAFTNFIFGTGTTDRRVSRLFIDRNQKVWAFVTNKQFVYDDSRGQFTPVSLTGIPENFTATAAVHDKQGFFWFASRTGLVRYDGKSCKHFNYNEGIPNDHIFDMDLDPTTQQLWMGTNLGLIKLSFKNQENNAIAAGDLTVANNELETFEPVWTEYNRNTGYPLDDLNHPALFVAPGRINQNDSSSGSILWAGFSNKLFRFDPNGEEAKSKPKLIIRTLRLDGRIIPWNSLMESSMTDSLLSPQESLVLGKSLTSESRARLREEFRGVNLTGVEKFSQLPRDLVLPHHINQITFEFGVISTSPNKLINYQYRLRGQEEEWSYSTKENSATFTDPWEGSYSFEVRALLPNGSWTKPTGFSFSVSPPWWRTWPMYAAYAITFLLLFFALVKMREHKLRQEKKFLENIVTERTNEVMDQMRSAELQKQEIQKQKQEADRQRTIVEEKNKEIARQLSDTEASLSNLTLQMIQRFHAYGELELELKKLAETSDAKKYQRAFSLITMNKSLDKEWEQFNFYFNGIYKDFNNKLREQSEQLSNYDLRMCALIKMGLENREIAMLLNIEVSSVKMAKYRLKKKFNIDESVSLQAYFETL